MRKWVTLTAGLWLAQASCSVVADLGPERSRAEAPSCTAEGTYIVCRAPDGITRGDAQDYCRTQDNLVLSRIDDSEENALLASALANRSIGVAHVGAAYEPTAAEWRWNDGDTLMRDGIAALGGFAPFAAGEPADSGVGLVLGADGSWKALQASERAAGFICEGQTSGKACWTRMFLERTYVYCAPNVAIGGWETARRACVARGGRLSNLGEPAVSAQVASWANELSPNAGGVAVGASDAQNEGAWYWLDGSALSDGTENWSDSSPNDDARDFATLEITSGQWLAVRSSDEVGAWVCSLGEAFDCVAQNYHSHEYQFCAWPDGVRSDWFAAREHCWLLGMELARVDDADEDAELYARRHGSNVFIGASDLDVEGSWRWPDGEEFYVGNASGSAVNGLYEGFKANAQPDNLGDEDFGVIASSADWNDAAHDALLVRGWICESGEIAQR